MKIYLDTSVINVYLFGKYSEIEAIRFPAVDKLFELAGLLTREERLLHRSKFNMVDLSDQPHAISAFLNKCDFIVTYDKHFQKTKHIISACDPEEVIQKFGRLG